MQRGQLVTQGLAAARRHQDEGVAPTDDVLDDLSLMGPEIRQAENLP